MKRIFIIIAIFASIACLFAQNNVTITNLSISPNPFSPDNDGQSDVTNISFYLYYPSAVANPEIELTIYRNSNVLDIVKQDTFTPFAGQNFYTWDGKDSANNTVVDGNYGLQIKFNNPQKIYKIDRGIIVKTTYPEIEMISASPNPFSPNGDGYQDVQTVRTLIKNSDVHYLGTIKINFQDSTAKFVNDSDLTTIVSPNPIPYSEGAYLFLSRPSQLASQISVPSNIDYNIIVNGFEANITMANGLYKLGENYLRSYGAISSGISVENNTLISYGTDYLAVYAMPGNMSFNVYDINGAEISLNDLYHSYYGSFNDNPLDRTSINTTIGRGYAINLGVQEGQIPGEELEDGKYIYRITVSNESETGSHFSGEFIVNNNPIIISGEVNPNKISPQEVDGIFDQTIIQYNASEDAYITVKVWDANNQLVKNIIENQLNLQGIGNYVLWDGKNNLGQVVSQNSEDLYRIEVTAVDRYINDDVTSVNLDILVDNKAPDSPTLTQGSPSSLNTASIIVSGISSEINSSIILLQNGVDKGVVGTTPAYPGYFQFNVNLEEGNNQITVKLRDSVNNTGSPSNQVSYYLDSQAPIINSILPAANTVFTSIPISFSAQVTDNGTGVNNVRFGFSFNGSQNLIWKTGVKDADSNIYRCQLTSADINENVSQLAISMVISAIDNLNNAITLEEPISYNYFRPSATNPPTLTSTYPALDANIKILQNNQIKAIIHSENPLILAPTETNIILKNMASNEVLSHNNGATLNYVTDAENNYQLTLQLTNPLSTNGADDAIYQLIYTAENQVGQVITGNISFKYDTLNPTISSFLINQNTPLKVNNQYYHSTNIDSITVYLNDSLSGVDFASNMSKVQLYDQNNQVIAGIRRADANTGRITWALNNPIILNENTAGLYKIAVKATDLATNTFEKEITFRLLSPSLPQIVEHTPLANSNINVLLNNRISKKVLDNNGFGLDRLNTSIILQGPTQAYQHSNGAKLTFTNLGSNYHQINLQLTSPLATDGSDDGVYTVQTTIIDTLSQSTVHNMSFTYDTQAPIISNRKIGGTGWNANLVDNMTINQNINYVSIDLSDFTSQVNFQSSHSYLFVYNANNQIVPGTQTNQGNTILYTLSSPLLNNGSNDGAYYIKYKATDNAGNIANGEINFRLINPAAPQITNVYPANNALVNNITNNTIEVEFSDERPFDLYDYTNNYIKVTRPNNTVLGHNQGANQQITSLGNNNYKMTLTLEQPLSLNGTYSLQIKLQNTQEYYTEFNTSFIFDNISPDIQSVKLGLQNGTEIAISGNENIYNGVNYIKVEPVDLLSGVDYESPLTFINITINGENSVGVLEKNESQGYLKFTFDEPIVSLGTQVGIQISASDKANNLVTRNIGFILNALQAEIISVSPANNSYINQNLNQIKLIVEYPEEVVLNESLSYLSLKHPNGSMIANGVGANLHFIKNSSGYEIVLNLNQPLANNGQDDGEYKIYAFFATNSFQEGPITFTFTYDRLNPYYENLKINDMVVSSREKLLKPFAKTKKSRNGFIFSQPITEIQVDYHDLTSPVDFATNLSSLTLVSPTGNLVQGWRVVNGSTISWVLNNPIPVDGTKDGVYTIQIKATDLAGNILNSNYNFTLMSHIIPQLVDYTPQNVINHYVNSFSPAVITGSFKNVIPIIQDPALTNIKLVFPNGEVAQHLQGGILSYQTEQNNLKATFQLTSGLNTDGENDGEYQILFKAMNQYGAEFDTTMTFIYDMVIPSFTELALVKDNTPITVAQNSIIKQAFTSVQVKYQDVTSGIHYSPNITSIALYDPENRLIPGTLSYIGEGTNKTCSWSLQDANYITLDGTKDGVYKIKMKALDKAGNSFIKEITFNLISIIPPQNIATYLDAVHKIHLSWDNPSPLKKRNNSRSVSNYQVFRKVNDGDFVQITQTSSLYYSDNLQEANDGTYTYMVKALYTIPGNAQVIASEGTESDPIQLKRFTPCTFNITLSDNQTPSDILFHLLGNDGIYNQELNFVTNQIGIINLPAIFMTDYLITIAKDGYQTINDTININLANNQFNYILQKNDPQLGGKPENYALYQNFPNPFNPTTEIRFALKNNSIVDLAVYNIKGQRIKTLLGQNLDFGYHKAVWNGDDSEGKRVSSGIYFYILNVKSNEDNYKEIKKMLLVK